MVYDPVLKDLVEIQNENYFYFQRLKFWKNYAEYLHVDIDPSWYSKDSFKIPMEDLNLDTGKQFTTIYESSLAATIKRDIKNRFNTVQAKMDRYLDGIEKKSQQVNFLRRIQADLILLFEQIKFTDNNYYLNVIRTTFEFQSKELIVSSKKKLGNNNFTNVVTPEIDNSSIYYKFLENDKGNEALENFCRTLKRGGWIENTSILNLKKIFSDRPSSKKAAWKGGKNEFLYLFQELRDRGLFSFENIWKASSKNFIILKKDGTEYSNKELKNVGELRNSKKRMRIDALIELLEIK